VNFKNTVYKGGEFSKEIYISQYHQTEINLTSYI